MKDYNTMSEITELVKETFDKCGEPELFDSTTIQWNSRFTRRMGDAIYYRRTKNGRVRFSSVLWERASPEERRETVIHEACHIVAEKNHPGANHGPVWKRYMKMAGAKGDRCHNVNRDGLRRRQKRVTFHCGCKEWDLTQNRATRLKNNPWRSYFCQDCKQTLKLGPKPNGATTTMLVFS